MKKNIGIIIGVVVAVIAVIAVIFMFTNNGGSVGLDSSIQNEDNRSGNTTLDSDRVLVTLFF